MWNVHPNKIQFDGNYGPDYGVDYARFSDPPDVEKDLLLKTLIEEKLPTKELDLTVRNGFVIIKGKVLTDEARKDILEFIKKIPGVVEVINQISVNENFH